MIARVAAHHHRILFRRALHLRAGQVIEQHIELRPEQLTVTLFEMLLQLRLVRQNPVQTPVQPGVVDLAFLDLEQIIQSRAANSRKSSSRVAPPSSSVLSAASWASLKGLPSA